MSLSIDLEVSKILTLVLEKAIELEELLEQMRKAEGSVHAPYVDFDISVRYSGDQGEWFAASMWTGDWFEIVEGAEREQQLTQRAERDAKR